MLAVAFIIFNLDLQISLRDKSDTSHIIIISKILEPHPKRQNFLLVCALYLTMTKILVPTLLLALSPIETTKALLGPCQFSAL